MIASRYAVLVAASAVAGTGITTVANAAESGRRIEEVVVTAERRESTVSDTSLSITAFGEEMLEDFGIQGADELVNFTPSTTRDAYDIRIRGVGRNFRALGGDPGVATYYNGVYSEDFGIAASEAALYDIARVEVLRGPQGTLYGRNAIGGALNYITNRPSYETEAEIRFLGGNLNAEEWYGVVSGPLIEDKLAYRFTAVRRDRDGAMNGIDGSEDIDSVGDQNLAIALNWRMTDNMEFNVRYNDRDSDRIIGDSVLVSEGTSADRGQRMIGRDDIPTWQYTYGIAPVPANILGVIPYTGPRLDYTDPNTGGIVQGIYVRPGVDRSPGTRINSSWRQNPDVFDDDIEDLNGDVMSNNQNDETFKHNAVQADWTWDINENMQLKWIGGWSDFDYTFLQDLDDSTSRITQYDQAVIQSLENWSQEVQLLWDIGDNLQLTTGLYYFDQNLRQQYDQRDLLNQGRYVNPANYGLLAPVAAALGTPVGIRSAEKGQLLSGAYGGDPFGRVYAIDNKVNTEAFAVFSQGTYTFNENWALTLGFRYAKDQKDADEQRGGYTTIDVNDPTNPLAPVLNPIFEGVCTAPPPAGYGAPSCEALGLTPLAMTNIFMGNASFVPTLDPQMPIQPTCALDDPNCQTPLRVQGLPISFADRSVGSEEWDDINFRVNVDWSPNEDTLIYGSVTTGYRAGGYSLGILGTQQAQFDEAGNAIPGTRGEPLSYDDETVVAYEIGYKGTLFDERLQLFSSLYFYDYEGYQDRVEALNAQGGADDVIVNAGDAENWGWEVEATWLATDKWTIGGNYSYTQTEYKDDLFIVVNDNPALPQPLFEQEAVNVQGNDLKRIPDHKATVWSWYDITFPAGTLTLGGVYSYTGQYYSSAIKRDLDRVRSRFRVDLSAIWRDNRDRWIVRAFADNVTDEGFSREIGAAATGSGFRQTAQFLYPRFYGVEVTYRFDHWL